MNNKKIFITGATGSFGKEFIYEILNKFKPNKIIIYSRDEVKQFDLKNDLKQFKFFEYILGDIRDFARLNESMTDVDYVIHAAALKQVNTAEINPFEFIKTNINGTENVIKAAIQNKVKKVITLSTDKACNPINLYGATKLCADKLTIAANNFSNNSQTKLSVTRYGNVVGSRGSIVPFLINLKKNNLDYFPITDEKMTRFWITLKQSVNFVIDNLSIMNGGEIFIPKIPSIKITSLANVIDKKRKFKIIGIRPGEKIHEMMFDVNDSNKIYELKNSYVMHSEFENINKKILLKKFPYLKNSKKIKNNFNYSSDNNIFLNKSQIKKTIYNFL